MKYPAFIATLLLSAAVARAETITWDAALRMADERNPAVNSARASYDSNRASYHSIFNGVLPQLSLSNTYSTSDSDRNGQYQAAGRASIDLFNYNTVAGIRLAGTALTRSEAVLRDVSSGVLFDLRRSFANLLF